MKRSDLDIRIVRINEVSRDTSFNRWEIHRLATHDAEIKVDLSARLEQVTPDEQILLHLEVIYTYMRGMVRRPLLRYAVESVYEIPGIDEFISFNSTREKVDIPPSLMSLMLGTSIGAMRGMLAVRTAGTPLESRPLPLINLTALVSRLIHGTPPPAHVIQYEEQRTV